MNTTTMENVNTMDIFQKATAMLKPTVKNGVITYPSEHLEQVFTVAWFRTTYPDTLIHAIPNGGKRSKREAARLKAEGVEPGIPDLFIPTWFLWIEMKRQKGGSLSKEQKQKIAYLEAVGYKVLVCKGFIEAVEKITSFYQKTIAISQ